MFSRNKKVKIKTKKEKRVYKDKNRIKEVKEKKMKRTHEKNKSESYENSNAIGRKIFLF